MKIGIVCPYHIFRGGGVQECVLAVQQELSKRGHDAKVITPLPRDVNTGRAKGIIFIGTSANVKSPFHTTAQVSVNLDTDSSSAILNREKFDVLHFHEPWVPIMSRQLLTQSTSANVATFHAKLPETAMSKTIERVITPYTKSVLKYLHSFTAVSEAAAGYVHSLTKKPVTIIANGINLQKYKPGPTKPKSASSTILFVGRLEKRKGLKYLLDAFGIYRQSSPQTKLIIAGDGPDRKKLQEYVANSGLESSVVFAGFVSESQKRKLFKQADLFCSPAPYGESFGIVLLEAMAHGLPIIAGDNPGYASVLRGRGALSLVNPRDSQQFARQIKLFLEDKQLASLWREWALDSVTQYDYSRIVDNYERIYNKAIAEKNSRGT